MTKSATDFSPTPYEAFEALDELEDRIRKMGKSGGNMQKNLLRCVGVARLALRNARPLYDTLANINVHSQLAIQTMKSQNAQLAEFKLLADPNGEPSETKGE